jgi:YrbI family 3-deoxy-D-manno-octulosonate 8-phosphate phosphatase
VDSDLTRPPGSPGGVLAVVPARGGSKGLPGKNLRPLDGHPLIAWAIAAGTEARTVDRVICSTDDPAIATAAEAAGAEVPFLRPSYLARDRTADLPVFQHLLRWLADQEGYDPEIVVHLRPTTPLRRPGDVDEAVHRLHADGRASSCRSVCPAPHSPYKMWTVGLDGALAPLLTLDGIPEAYNEPRQRLPEVLWHNGVIDAVRSDVIRSGSMTGTRILPLEIDPFYAVDIDHLTDLHLAESRLPTITAVRPRHDHDWDRVRLLVVDVDGTLTPGTAYYTPEGEALKRFHTHDAHGLALARDHGVTVIAMTAESTAFPEAWGRKVGVEQVVLGVRDKASAVADACVTHGIDLDEVCMVGDDWSDVGAFALVRAKGGLTCAVGNARPEVVAEACYRCAAPGGAGAVREVCDRIVAARAARPNPRPQERRP